MNRTGGARPSTVGRRATDDAGSGTLATPGSSKPAGSREREPLPTRVRDLPPVPPAFDEVVARGLERIGLTLDDGALGAIDAHVRLLVAWTVAINLTAIREPAAIAREHVLDSLAAVPLLRERGIDAFVDLGSGGGFPGLPLAVALPARRALLVDSIGKKARFLATVVAALDDDGLLWAGTTEVAARRAEELATDASHRERWPGVVARAVAGLAELAELAFPLLARGGSLVAWKRAPFAEELDEAEAVLGVLGGGRIEVRPVGIEGLEDHVLVAIEKRGPTPARFPRSPAERRRASADGRPTRVDGRSPHP